MSVYYFPDPRVPSALMQQNTHKTGHVPGFVFGQFSLLRLLCICFSLKGVEFFFKAIDAATNVGEFSLYVYCEIVSKKCKTNNECPCHIREKLM